MSSARLAEFCGGSPVAERFDPPVTRYRWLLARDCTPAELEAETRQRTRLDADGLAQVIWHGGMYVDGHRLVSMPTTSLGAGTRITLYVFAHEPDRVELGDDAIVYDQDGVVGVDKPAWLPMQGTRASHRISLETQVRHLTDCPTATPVHRLDRQTSGIVLFARTPQAASWLSLQFRQRRVDKSYLAWVHPAPPERRWTVRGNIVQQPHPHHACFALGPGDGPGRPSLTELEVVRTDGQRALVRAWPKTGRTHQIRVHLAAGGTPIVGDTLYGPSWHSDHPSSASRLLLHAHTLTLRMARGDQPKTLTATPPPDVDAD